MKILKSILNYIPLATFIIFVVTDGIFSLTSALIFVISTIGLLINWKRKKQRWRIEKIPVYRDDTTIIFAWKKEYNEKEKNCFLINYLQIWDIFMRIWLLKWLQPLGENCTIILGRKKGVRIIMRWISWFRKEVK